MLPFAGRNSDCTLPRLKFSVELLVTLAITLLCALLPTGQPRTLALGSAFNPATSTDVVRVASRNDGLLLDRVRITDDNNIAPGTSAALIIVALNVESAAYRSAIILLALPVAAFSAARYFFAFESRGPPAA